MDGEDEGHRDSDSDDYDDGIQGGADEETTLTWDGETQVDVPWVAGPFCVVRGK